MRIEREENYIKFRFTDIDYKTKKNEIALFLKAIKLNIPTYGRKYISGRRQWIISISFENTFNELYLKYIDKSQLKAIR